MTKWRSVRQEDIRLLWNQLPLLSASLPAHQVEAPRIELRLPGATPDLDAADTGAGVKQILAVRNALDHLDALGTCRCCIKISALSADLNRRTLICLTVEGQVVVPCNQDLARVRLRAKPLTKGFNLLRLTSLREVSRVEQHVAFWKLDAAGISTFGRMRVTNDDKSHLVLLLCSGSLECGEVE